MQLLSRRQQGAPWACATAGSGTRGLPAQCLQSSPPRAHATDKRRMRPRCASQAPARFPRRPHNAPRLRGARQPRCSAHDRDFREGALHRCQRKRRTFSEFRCTESLCACATSCAKRRACSSVLGAERVSALLACPRERKPKQGRARAVGSSAVSGAGCVSASTAARLNSAAAWTAASARSLAASSSRRGSNCCRIHSSSLCAAKYSRCCCCAKLRLYSAYLQVPSAAEPSAARSRARPHLASASASDRLAGSSLAANCLKDMSSPRLLPAGTPQERQRRRSQASPKVALTVGARRRRADHARGLRKRLSSTQRRVRVGAGMLPLHSLHLDAAPTFSHERCHAPYCPSSRPLPPRCGLSRRLRFGERSRLLERGRRSRSSRSSRRPPSRR